MLLVEVNNLGRALYKPLSQLSLVRSSKFRSVLHNEYTKVQKQMRTVHNAAQHDSTVTQTNQHIMYDTSLVEGIHNFRDLASACPGIRQGQFFRCGNPTKATDKDVKTLINDFRISDMLDLRAKEEIKEDDGAKLFEGVTIQQYRRKLSTREVVPSTVVAGSDGKVKHHISLLERRRFYWYLLQELPRDRLITALMQQITSREGARTVLLEEVNEGGLQLLYRILLLGSGPELAAVLRLALQTATANRPLLFFCKAGKDRTGLVSALLLKCMGASHDQIIADYYKSDAFRSVALAGLENRRELRGLDRSTFERAPAPVMRDTLSWMEGKFGSVEDYMVSIGFGQAEQAKLRQAMRIESKL